MEKYYKEFDDYVSKFDMDEPNIISKYRHSYRVMNLQEKYSKILGYDDHNIKLAKLIGLLHDIGRFKQYEEYSTFSDLRSIDHADLGVKILFDDRFIDKFWECEDDYDIINFSIKNHNKYSISKTDNQEMTKHAKLIRDTDKIDIIYLMAKFKEYNKTIDNRPLSPKIVETLFNHKPINIKDINNPNDAKATYLAFAYDVNNTELLEELRTYLISLYYQINHDKIYDEVFDEINKYIDERTDTNVRKKIQSLRSRE